MLDLQWPERAANRVPTSADVTLLSNALFSLPRRCRHNVLMSLYIFNPVVVEKDPDLNIVVEDWESRRDPSSNSVRA